MIVADQPPIEQWLWSLPTGLQFAFGIVCIVCFTVIIVVGIVKWFDLEIAKNKSEDEDDG